ncbi:hypothetical protein VQ056_10615 [Paenibacillus sp. JTLBN-2024]
MNRPYIHDSKPAVRFRRRGQQAVWTGGLLHENRESLRDWVALLIQLQVGRPDDMECRAD